MTRACKHCKVTDAELGPIGMWQHCPKHEDGMLCHEWPDELSPAERQARRWCELIYHRTDHTGCKECRMFTAGLAAVAAPRLIEQAHSDDVLASVLTYVEGEHARPGLLSFLDAVGWNEEDYEAAAATLRERLGPKPRRKRER